MATSLSFGKFMTGYETCSKKNLSLLSYEGPFWSKSDNKIAPQVNFNPTAANIMDIMCIFVITKQYFFQRVSNYF